MKNKHLFLIILFSCCMYSLNAMPSYNDITPSAFLHRLAEREGNSFSFFIEGAFAYNDKGFNEQGGKVGTCQYLDEKQNALAMLKGSVTGTEVAALNALLNGVGDDGIRGHYVVDADYKRPISCYLGGVYSFSFNWWVGAFIPFIKSSLKNVVWTSLTQDITAEDILFEDELGNNFFNQVAQLSHGLSLEPWEKNGPGDLSLWIGWQEEFVQQKEWIKKVTPHIRAGFTIPTGVKKDEDKSFFLPFGNDGAAGIQVGIGLTLNLKEYVNAGIDVEFLHAFTTTRERRIKTDVGQTEGLLLNKTLVSKDPSLTERFTLFAEIVPNSWLQARIQYNFIKESEAHLYPLSNEFSYTIANSASSLKGFTSHTVVTTLEIAGSDYARWMPDFSVAYAHPFHGKRVVQADHISIGLSYSF